MGALMWDEPGPERSEHPAGSAGLFPTGHAAPDAGGLEVGLLIAHQRRPVQRCLVIRAASGLRVQEVHPAFLAARDHEFAAFEREDSRRNLHIEVALLEPRPVGGLVIVDQLQLASFHARANQAVAVDLLDRIVEAVAGGRPGGSRGVNGRATSSQRPPLPGLYVITFFSGSFKFTAQIWFGLPAQPCEVVVNR